MSNYARRGCFKCGNVGHIAEACESQTRLCFNCRSPEHESSSCPHPRTTEAKQCYTCSGVGHISASCPSLAPGGALRGAAPGGPKCYSCGFPGHVARLCPNAQAMPINTVPGNFAGGFRPPPMIMQQQFAAPRGFRGQPGGPATPGLKCYRCEGAGHFARDCPTPAALIPGARPKNCYKCGNEGHIARECPEAAPVASTPASASAATETVTSPTTEAPLAAAPAIIPAAAEIHA